MRYVGHISTQAEASGSGIGGNTVAGPSVDKEKQRQLTWCEELMVIKRKARRSSYRICKRTEYTVIDSAPWKGGDQLWDGEVVITSTVTVMRQLVPHHRLTPVFVFCALADLQVRSFAASQLCGSASSHFHGPYRDHRSLEVNRKLLSGVWPQGLARHVQTSLRLRSAKPFGSIPHKCGPAFCGAGPLHYRSPAQTF